MCRGRRPPRLATNPPSLLLPKSTAYVQLSMGFQEAWGSSWLVKSGDAASGGPFLTLRFLAIPAVWTSAAETRQSGSNSGSLGTPNLILPWRFPPSAYAQDAFFSPRLKNSNARSLNRVAGAANIEVIFDARPKA